MKEKRIFMERICLIEENKENRNVLISLPSIPEQGGIFGIYSESVGFGRKLGVCFENGKLLLVPQYDEITVEWYRGCMEFICEEWIGEDCLERTFVLDRRGQMIDKRWYKEER